MNKKVLLTSLMSIAMLASITTGATYALFTAEDKIDVAITSGKVNVTAIAENFRTYSNGVLQTNTDGTPNLKFENGGSLVYTTIDNTLAVNNIMPMDKVEFDIKITNNSNVDIKYQTIISLTEGLDLFSGLEITVDGKVFNGITTYTTWKNLATTDAKEIVVPVSIELPEEAGNEYQGLTTKLSYSVKAVQGNGTVEEIDENTTYIHNATDLRLFAKSVNNGNTYSGKTVKLMSNIDLNNENWTPIGLTGDVSGFQGTFDGNNKIISNLKVEQLEPKYQSAGLFGSARYATIKNFQIINATIDNITTGNAAGWTSCGTAVVVGSAQFPATIENVDVTNATVNGNRYVSVIAGYFDGTITGCDVVNARLTAKPDNLHNGSYDNGDKVGGILAYRNTSAVVTGNTVKDITIRGYRDLGGIAGAANAAQVTGNTATNVNITVDQITGFSELKAENADYIVGRCLDGVTVDSSNTYSGGSITKLLPEVVTPSNVVDITFEDGKTYLFVGEFTEENYDFKVTTHSENHKNIVIDGYGATFPNAKRINFEFKFHDGQHSFYSNGEFATRDGEYTIKEFTLNEGSLTFGSISTTINVLNNNVSAMYFETSNTILNIKDNNVVSDGNTAYLNYHNASSLEYGISILATNYVANIENNLIENPKKHAIGICGRTSIGEIGETIPLEDVTNSITLKGNEFKGVKEDRSALHIWADHIFAQSTNLSYYVEYTAQAEALVNTITSYVGEDKNTIDRDGRFISFDQYKLNTNGEEL